MNASKLRELTVKLKCSLLPSTDVKAGIRNAGGDDQELVRLAMCTCTFVLTTKIRPSQHVHTPVGCTLLG
jgi:hypothetical protein